MCGHTYLKLHSGNYWFPAENWNYKESEEMDTANTGSDVQGSGGRQSNFKTYFPCHLANPFESQSQRSIQHRHKRQQTKRGKPQAESQEQFYCVNTTAQQTSLRTEGLQLDRAL